MTTDEVAKTALSTHAITSSVVNDKKATETQGTVNQFLIMDFIWG